MRQMLHHNTNAQHNMRFARFNDPKIPSLERISHTLSALDFSCSRLPVTITAKEAGNGKGQEKEDGEEEEEEEENGTSRGRGKADRL
ncbi:hypothetical protein WR25_05712 [Diploscapter pachys]|uniref:Uncharacterized protein n=1 Tax=Diploscapter pachys TaxID=2018661 RepID=A0A2A2LSR6_9BILA|nr:hypothetical protein WR25_05712 [Diploscapter pachys]